MGSGTIEEIPCLSSSLKFQSLPGINGVWHREHYCTKAVESYGFNPFQGLMGSGTRYIARGSNSLWLVSIPSRD